ncbi:MAG: response regulator [bacterium]
MKKLILIADDDAKHRKLLTDVLQAEGHATLTIENGERIIEMARSAKLSLILMDIQMPLIDGLSAIKLLKSDPDMWLIPVIAVTALAMREDYKRMLAAGFDGYLSKPISIKELRTEVNRHLGGESRP